MKKTRVKIAFVSTYPPRKCGIATFTKSFVQIFDDLYIGNRIKIIAISNERKKFSYPSKVVFEIDQFNQQSYAKAAEFINRSDIEAVSLQHEYGIFGGEDGEHILKFLENVDKPVVTSFHTVLREHSDHRRKLMQRIIDLSDSIVVMTNSAKNILVEEFNVAPSKIKIIHHGVPNISFDDKAEAKERLGFTNKTVCLTFGLINRGKGIEVAIEAIRRLAKKFPDILYLVVGATHPDIIKQEGESYRKSLEKAVSEKGTNNNVKFINRYLDYRELVDYLKAADIYLAPQIDLQQSFSGTIAYALGCGNAVISSPTNYALEVLANGRGIIINPSAKQVTKELKGLLSLPSKRRKMQLKAYQFAREMIWPKVGIEYLEVLESSLFVKNERWMMRLPDFAEKPSLAHLKKMTDGFGIVQHAVGSKPDYRFGYSLDDQARAAIACGQYLSRFKDKEAKILLEIYLAYLDKAVDENGLIHNLIDRKEMYADKFGSDDSISRSFWALSYIAGLKNIPEKIKEKAAGLVSVYWARLSNSYIQPISYNLLGYFYQSNKKEVERLADILLERFDENLENGKWHWFEDKLTYANGITPYALIKAYQLIGKRKYLDAAVAAVEFLYQVCRYKGIPMPIGQDGWFVKNGKKAIFDQQPIEAGDMVLLYNLLHEVSGEYKYKERAVEWMGWYFGNNIGNVVLYDNITHGVYDGLTRTGYNENQGAESIGVYLMAYLSFKADASTGRTRAGFLLNKTAVKA